MSAGVTYAAAKPRRASAEDCWKFASSAKVALGSRRFGVPVIRGGEVWVLVERPAFYPGQP